MKRVIKSANAPAPIGPYSQAILIENTLYISGQIALDANTGELENENIQKETKKVMDNLGSVLNEAGADYSNIVKCSIFVSDLNNFAAINEVYANYFTSDFPARETVEVSRLPKDVNVEISAIAVI
ncbi:RidA family protein [Acidiluteibacter ferrifornacis]|mgnify:CR=1 FL=1|uniref:RidA family protein n=1 Tax=Acidiluteibacter ferrifornacis TaxID=2692424 RepID=A0A6N9NME6_9FLAO|nr:RidA family protein [Acidiluteibacter ferrifornacis]NBG66277.1 RidA family protein [Acidiluteibacter ferrifornacis]